MGHMNEIDELSAGKRAAMDRHGMSWQPESSKPPHKLTLEERKVEALERIARALEADAAAASFLDEALQPGNDAAEPTIKDIDFFRTTEGEFRIRTPIGNRAATPFEAALLSKTLPARDRRR